MKSRPLRLFALSFLPLPLLIVGAFANSANTVQLGTAGSYAVLAGSTVTNTGSSVLTGNLGVSAGCAVTGFPPGSVSGTIHRCDAAAAKAQRDLTTAYNKAAGLTRTAMMRCKEAGATVSSSPNIRWISGLQAAQLSTNKVSSSPRAAKASRAAPSAARRTCSGGRDGLVCPRPVSAPGSAASIAAINF